VELKFLIKYTTGRRPGDRSGDTPGATLEEHENLHIRDFLSWCGSLNSKYKSEGFPTLAACPDGLKKFLQGLKGDFNQTKADSDKSRDR